MRGSTSAERRRLRWAMAAVGLLTAAWAVPGIGVRATFGAHVAVDEPQYLLTATSLFEDLDLDIADELRDRRWRDYHQAPLPEQTAARDDGRRYSPHDPLLPAVLAVPMGVGGWVGAKLTLAAMAGGLAAALLWVAARRLRVPLGAAALVVLCFSLSPPLSVYATQVYPELPAALVTTLGVAALTARPRRATATGLGLAVVALPWLSVKYAPVAAALAAVGLWRLWRAGRRPLAGGLTAALVVAAAVHAVAHLGIYGGLTPYAAGDHFTGGELTVAGVDPDYWGRSRRLLGLLVDRNMGLVAWQPAWLLALPALASLARRRPRWWPAVALPLAAGWATATFVALTAHGFWWPGRQTVVVLPLLVLTVAWWAGVVAPAARRLAAAGLAAGAATWAWLVVEGLDRRLTWVVDFTTTRGPVHRSLRPLLPDLRVLAAGDEARYWAWVVAAAGLAAAGWWSTSGGRAGVGRGAGGDEDPAAGEGADADHPVVDVDRHRAIR